MRSDASVDLFWLPLGAGDGSGLVRRSGRAFEAVLARRAHRQRCDLYHSALAVQLDGATSVIEMAPVWGNRVADRGVVGEGAVGIGWLGRSRLFRYEVRRWAGGLIADVDEAVDSPQRMSADRDHAQRVLDLAGAFPTRTWGRDELGTGEMWNSNSLTSWLLARSGHRTEGLEPPPHGRAPGWSAGLVAAARESFPGDGDAPAAAPVPRLWTRATGLSTTRADADGCMPGDELVREAKYRTTHAVDIAAPAERVWPWLVQLGQGRGGMYSYDWLENLLGLHMHSADRIDAALQRLAVGDVVRLVPEGTQPALRFAVTRVDAPYVLVLGPDGSRSAAFAAGLPYPSWTFHVVPTGVATSRLVVRFRSDFEPTRRGLLLYKHALRPVHFVMERKMMLGLKQRAEWSAA